MSYNTQIIKALASQWNNSAALRTYPIRSTRVPAGVNVTQPYAVIDSAVVGRRQFSGKSQLTTYLITFRVFAGLSKGTLDTIAGAISALFSNNIGLPVNDNCYVLQVVPVIEDPETDAADYYGEDVNVLVQQFRVTLNETRPAVNSTLAT
jgi:hypothetical protein